MNDYITGTDLADSWECDVDVLSQCGLFECLLKATLQSECGDARTYLTGTVLYDGEFDIDCQQRSGKSCEDIEHAQSSIIICIVSTVLLSTVLSYASYQLGTASMKPIRLVQLSIASWILSLCSMISGFICAVSFKNYLEDYFVYDASGNKVYPDWTVGWGYITCMITGALSALLLLIFSLICISLVKNRGKAAFGVSLDNETLMSTQNSNADDEGSSL